MLNIFQMHGLPEATRQTIKEATFCRYTMATSLKLDETIWLALF